MDLEIKPDYSQTFVLPPSIDDWVPMDHPVRFIKEFVESIDLKEFGFKIRKSKSGRPNYSSKLLLKVWLYGIFEKIYSSRSLEKACKNQLPFIWLTGMNYPDHNTIWRFFKNHKEIIDKVFRHSVYAAVKNDMVGFCIQALDGTKILANVNKRRSLHKKDLEKLLFMLDEPLGEILDKVEEQEVQEQGIEGCSLPKKLQDKENLKKLIQNDLKELSDAEKKSLKGGVRRHLAEMTEMGESHICLTDPDTRLMISKSKIDFQFNAQAVVDHKNQIIVGSSVTNENIDHHLLNKMIDEAEENTGQKTRLTLADGGYFSGYELHKAKKSGHRVLVNHVIREKDDKKKCGKNFNKSQFKYDPENDTYICPEGHHLKFERKVYRKRQRNSVRFYRCKNHRNCKYSQLCSQDKRGRSIEHTSFENNIYKNERRNKLPASKRLLAKRKVIVEPVFGWIKFNNGLRRWQYWGLVSVEGQWQLMCCGVNLKKIYEKWRKGEIVF